MSLQQRVSQAFVQRFRAPPALIVRSPGRVNLIGGHTDYNDGFVLPLAIDRAAWIALRPRRDRRVVVHSSDLDQETSFSLEKLEKGPAHWSEYLKAVAWALQQAGHRLCGWEGVLTGDVPLGAGLSSSAALEMAAARAFAAVAGLPWEATAMAKICQRAENQWIGVQCGIMDSLIAAAGQAGHALLVDCRSLELQPVPLPANTLVVVLDTGTRRELAGSAYNERREQCARAARALGVPALRDVSPARFREQAAQLDERARRCARHVITENARTLQAAEAMRRGDAVTLGQQMQASHASLRDDFDVSSVELDAMVDCAQRQADCYGARMTGAGFGGCVVALVRSDTAQLFANAVSACYRSATGIRPQIYPCRASQGVAIISILENGCHFPHIVI